MRESERGQPVWARLLLLTVVLNVVRYTAAIPFEWPIVEQVFAEMAAHPALFRTQFTAADWATSFAYNFGVWYVAVLAFHFMNPSLPGGWWLRNVGSWGLMWAMFACISAVYMNHYAHPRAFYLWNMADALVVFAILAWANGLLYPVLVSGQPPLWWRRRPRASRR